MSSVVEVLTVHPRIYILGRSVSVPFPINFKCASFMVTCRHVMTSTSTEQFSSHDASFVEGWRECGLHALCPW